MLLLCLVDLFIYNSVKCGPYFHEKIVFPLGFVMKIYQGTKYNKWVISCNINVTG